MDVNREMILQGKAVPYLIYPNFERVQPYLDSLKEANSTAVSGTLTIHLMNCLMNSGYGLVTGNLISTLVTMNKRVRGT
jgi:hypothetical protein